MAGYSGTSLAKKLGIKPGTILHPVDAPKNYRALIAPLPEGVRLAAQFGGDTDIAHVFALERARLNGTLGRLRGRMRSDAAIWVSWPKKASKVATDITEDTIREIARPLGLVDIKVCAVDDTWSGLKLVLRRENRE